MKKKISLAMTLIMVLNFVSALAVFIPSVVSAASATSVVYQEDFSANNTQELLTKAGWTFTGNSSFLGIDAKKGAKLRPSGSAIYVTFEPIAFVSESYGANAKITAEYKVAMFDEDISWHYVGFADHDEFIKSKSSNNPYGIAVAAGHRPKNVSSQDAGVWVYRKNYAVNTDGTADNIIVAGAISEKATTQYTIKYVIKVTDAQGKAITPTVDIYVNGSSTPVLSSKPLLTDVTEIDSFVIGYLSGTRYLFVDDVKVMVDKGASNTGLTPTKAPETVEPYTFPFTDVEDNAWYRKDVEIAHKNGLIDGKSEKEFAPQDNMTCAEAVKLACALNQLYYDGKVTLTNGEDVWYSTYMDYAKEKGIIENDLTDVADVKVTRRDFVKILYKAIPDVEYKAINVVVDDKIPDVKMADDGAQEIYAFYRAGILTGSDDAGTFYGESNITRAEVAAILTRMYDRNARKTIILN